MMPLNAKITLNQTVLELQVHAKLKLNSCDVMQTKIASELFSSALKAKTQRSQ